MPTENVQLRLRRRGHIRAEWTAAVDLSRPAGLRAELVGGIRADGGDTATDLHLYEVEYRPGGRGRWQTFRVGAE